MNLSISKPKNSSLFLYCALFFSLCRLLISLKNGSFILTDFIAYLDATDAMKNGLNPFSLSSLHIKELVCGYGWEEPPLFFPAQFLFFLPFLLFTSVVANGLFFFLQIALFFYMPFYILQKEKIPINTPLFLTLLLLLFNTGPILMTLRFGQLSLIVPFLFLLSWYSTKPLHQALFLSIGAALKCSLLPFLGLLFIAKRKYRVALFAFSLFLFWCITPFFFGLSLKELYHDYLSLIAQSTTGSGYNAYGGTSIYNFIHFDFLTSHSINILGKTLFTLSALAILYRERKANTLSLLSLLSLFLITMTISYHRIYDISFALLLLAIIGYQAVFTKKWRITLCSLSILLFYDIPVSWTYQFYRTLAPLFENQTWISISSDQDPTSFVNPLLPADAFLISSFALFSVFYYFKNK